MPVFSTSELPKAVNEEKLFGFMFYSAYRAKQPKSRKHDFFDKEDYDQVLADHPADRTSQFSDLEEASRDYAGPEAWEKAFGAVLRLAKHQRDETGVGLIPATSSRRKSSVSESMSKLVFLICERPASKRKRM